MHITYCILIFSNLTILIRIDSMLKGCADFVGSVSDGRFFVCVILVVFVIIINDMSCGFHLLYVSKYSPK